MIGKVLCHGPKHLAAATSTTQDPLDLVAENSFLTTGANCLITPFAGPGHRGRTQTFVCEEILTCSEGTDSAARVFSLNLVSRPRTASCNGL
jgi:hypothetical protein